MRSDLRMRRGGLLLEVLLALAIMTMALGLMSGQLSGGMRLTQEADAQTRAALLSDRVLALLELDMALAERFFTQQEIDGDFGDENPRWFWRARVEQIPDVTGLGRVEISILYQGDPNRPAEIEGAGVVRRMHLLKADPGRINLVEDFGVSEEKLAEFASLAPIPGLDPANLDPQALVSMDPQQLLELLPMLLPLLQQFGGGRGGDFDFSNGPPTPEQLAELLGQLTGGGGGERPPGIPNLPGMGGGGGRGGPAGGGLGIGDLNDLRGGGGRGAPPPGGRGGPGGPPAPGGRG